jgi:hypothetical protein
LESEAIPYRVYLTDRTPSTHLKSAMLKTPLTIEAEAQQVLDELWSEKLLPFKLSAGKITKEYGEYTLHSYDSRIRTVHIPLTKGQSFADMVRAAVLTRVGQVSGPLKDWKPGSDVAD